MNAIRKLVIRKAKAPVQELTGRRILVSGCSPNSIGYATAKILLAWGAQVTVTRRSDTECLVRQLGAEASAPDRVSGHDLDLSSAESVQDFAHWFVQERAALDVLINCAGIHLDLLSQWKAPRLSPDGFEIHWRTNYLGTIHLSHLLLPLLLESAAASGDARIVNVISMLHRRGRNSEFYDVKRPYNSWNAYGQSKLALAHFTMELQRRYADRGLRGCCLHPGEVFTNVAGKGLAGNPRVERVRNFLWPLEAFFMMTPNEGAQTPVYCATAPDAGGGQYYRGCRVSTPSAECRDAAVAQRLWNEGVDWVNALR